MDIDVTTLSSADLTRLMRQIGDETSRRDVLDNYPGQILGMVDQYRDAGGDMEALQTTVCDHIASLA